MYPYVYRADEQTGTCLRILHAGLLAKSHGQHALRITGCLFYQPFYGQRKEPKVWKGKICVE